MISSSEGVKDRASLDILMVLGSASVTYSSMWITYTANELKLSSVWFLTSDLVLQRIVIYFFAVCKGNLK
jgi:arginine exporter protein ArgO